MTPLVRAYVCICVRACALVYVRRDVLTYVRMYACTTYRSTYECMHARQIKDLRTFFSFSQLFQRINPRALALSYVQMHTRTQDVKTYMHTLYMHTYTCMPEYTHTHTHTHTHTRTHTHVIEGTTSSYSGTGRPAAKRPAAHPPLSTPRHP